MSTRVTTGKVRASYANLFVPTAAKEGQEKKYSVTLLIPKSDKETVKAINAAVDFAIQDQKAKKWGGKIPATYKHPLRDGDKEKPDNEEYEGMYFIAVRNSKAPKIVDRNRQEILNPDEVYSGCYIRASINFFIYNFEEMSKGVSASLDAVQKLEDGDHLSGSNVNVDQVFGGDFDDDL